MLRFNHVILGLAAVLTVVFVGLRLFGGESAQPPPPELTDEEAQSDYYVADARLQQTDEHGRLQYDITSAHMIHRQDQDIWLLRAPTMTIFTEQGEPWYGQAERGRIWDDGNEAELLGKVRLWRKASAENRPVTIDTHDVYLQPKIKYARTDAEVVVQQEQSWLTGIGAQVYLDEERYELLSAVKGYYVPSSD